MSISVGFFQGQNDAPPQKRGRGRPKKDPFENVPEEFKDETVSKSVIELKTLLSEVAMREMENKKHFKDDEHVKELKDQVREASAQYVEATKANNDKMAWLKALIEDKGGA